ncbi:MAG: hypothetical protein K9J06_03755 [Flavobacteriales bacterium]|nr:hypothetical protein [Flavobacteriales bacterium]
MMIRRIESGLRDILPYLLFTVFFWVFRVPYYLFVPVVKIDSDTFEYANLAWQMDLGLWPKFGWVPPLYPLFIFVTGKLGMSVLGMAVLQSIIAFLSGLLLIYAVHRVNRWCALALSCLLFAYYGSFNCIYYQDATMLTESLYSSSIVAVAALMILAIASDNRKWLALLSAVLAVPALIRPNGLAYIAVFFLFFTAIIAWKRNLRLALYALPFIAVIMLMGMYNIATMGTAIPFRIGLHADSNSQSQLDDDAKAMMLWHGVSTTDSAYHAFQSLTPAPVSSEKTTGKIYPESLGVKMGVMFNVDLQSGDILYRSNLLGGHAAYVYLPPPFSIMTLSDWRNYVGAPIPEGLIRYTVKEYWDEGIPDFQALHRSYGGKQMFLQRLLVQVSSVFHRMFDLFFGNTLPWAIASMVLAAMIMATVLVDREMDGTRLIVLLLTAVLALECIVTVLGAVRMLPRYAFPISFIYPVILVLSAYRLKLWIASRFNRKAPRS